jgi:ribose 5-phosphate isomerase A
VTLKGADPAAEDLARLAAQAVALLPSPAGGTLRVGLGSGRAASAFVRALAARCRAGLPVSGVPTSSGTASLARELGLPLEDLDRRPLDVTVDGADEVDPGLDLVKGYGGALTRERIVAAASRRQLILVTPDKLVPRLGTRGAVPVEVLEFARPLCEVRLEALGLRPRLRTLAGGLPFRTDNGHLILDAGLQPVDDARALDAAIRSIPGVVDTGFFLGTADQVLVAEAGAVRTLNRPGVRAGTRS